VSAVADNLAATAAPAPAAERTRLSPTFELACVCCLWPPSDERDRRVREASAGVDWEALLRVLDRQRVQGLAHAALASARAPTPPAIRDQLAARAAAIARRGAALAAETVRLNGRLAEAGIPALFVKGASLAALAYGSQTLKQGRDIDFVVPETEAEAAWRLLEADGYAPSAPYRDLSPRQRQAVLRLHKDLELTHPVRRTRAELHWRLTDNRALLPGLGAGSPSQTVRLPLGEVRTLADPELFAYLCVHGASHAWFRLKWLADLNAWLSHKTEAEIASLYVYAAAEGVEACAGQALLLRRRLFGAAPPAALAGRLERSWRMRWMTAAALDAVAGAGGEAELESRPFGPFRLLPTQFLRGRGLAFAAGQWGLMSESLDDALRYPLPPALRFLYPLMRLPLWVLRLVRRRRGRRAV
jgi:hypothetical protein